MEMEAVPAAALPGSGILCPWLHRQRGRVEGGSVMMLVGTSGTRPRDRDTEVHNQEGLYPGPKQRKLLHMRLERGTSVSRGGPENQSSHVNVLNRKNGGEGGEHFWEEG